LTLLLLLLLLGRIPWIANCALTLLLLGCLNPACWLLLG
jgi:hypothetical protein